MPSWRDRRFCGGSGSRHGSGIAHPRSAGRPKAHHGGVPILRWSSSLSGKELEVLRLMSTKLSRREIAAHLYVSINTVKTHQRAVFRKLEVADRAGAGSSSTGARRPVAGCVAMGRC
jgi:DNA-binding CsgD family transcriptional regulator